MPFNPEKHHRKSIRLKDYDYSQPGSYFITVCTHNQKNLFGKIVSLRAGLEPAPTENFHVNLNDYGIIVLNTWRDLVKHNKGIKLGEFVIMPNHFHGIIHILDPGNGGGDFIPSEFIYKDAVTKSLQSDSVQQGFVGVGSKPTLNQYKKQTSLSEVVRQFKTFSTRKINRLRNTTGVSIWQGNYFEHIIRNRESYDQIVEYIQNNPLTWKKDKLFID